MPVIDVDSHFMEPADWLEQADPQLARELPSPSCEDYSAEIILGEAMKKVPAAHHPDDLAALLSPGTLRHLDVFMSLQPPDGTALDPFYDGAARVRFCDEQGIDAQFLNPSFGYGAFVQSVRARDTALVSRTRAAWNTYAAQQVSGFTDRLMPVAQTNIDDIDWTIREMTRMRELGSRAFNIERAVGDGKFLTHPDFERMWSAAEDLGMAAYIHAGIAIEALDVSWAALNGRGLRTFVALHHIGSLSSLSFQLLLSALVLDGVFERHPKLAVIIAEAGHSWLPEILRKLDMMADRAAVETDIMAFVDLDPRTGEPMTPGLGGARGSQALSTYSMKPSEFVERHVRVAPLSGLAGLEPLSLTMDALDAKDTLVFSTDYPHPEGRVNARDLFGQELAAYDATVRQAFFGDSIHQLLAV